MPAQWTADVVGEMHTHRVTGKDLAKQAGVTPVYVSMVLNGHKNPAGAEDRFRKALQEILEQRKEGTR